MKAATKTVKRAASTMSSAPATSQRGGATWLVKSEPSVYPFEQLLKDKKTVWDGVRSFEARNNLRAMKKGDLLLFYHSNEGKAVVGVAKVLTEAFPDASWDEEGDENPWSAIEIGPVRVIAQPVPLATIKKTPKLAKIGLITRSRLSVVKVTQDEFDLVLAMGQTKLT